MHEGIDLATAVRALEAPRKGAAEERRLGDILREGMATDDHDKASVYFGTNTGQLYVSRDEGDSCDPIAETLPNILSVTTGTAR